MGTSGRPLLDEATVAFLRGGVSVVASACDGGNLSVVRALGCRISSDRRRVTVLVPGTHPFVEAVSGGARIAVAFTLPSTHHAVQVKGEHGTLRPARRDDRELHARYVDAFVADLCPLGYTEELMRALTWCDPAELVAVTFHPTAVFLQTPGPRAGESMTAEAPV